MVRRDSQVSSSILDGFVEGEEGKEAMEVGFVGEGFERWRSHENEVDGDDRRGRVVEREGG